MNGLLEKLDERERKSYSKISFFKIDPTILPQLNDLNQVKNMLSRTSKLDTLNGDFKEAKIGSPTLAKTLYIKKKRKMLLNLFFVKSAKQTQL